MKRLIVGLLLVALLVPCFISSAMPVCAGDNVIELDGVLIKRGNDGGGETGVLDIQNPLYSTILRMAWYSSGSISITVAGDVPETGGALVLRAGHNRPVVLGGTSASMENPETGGVKVHRQANASADYPLVPSQKFWLGGGIYHDNVTKTVNLGVMFYPTGINQGYWKYDNNLSFQYGNNSSLSNVGNVAYSEKYTVLGPSGNFTKTNTIHILDTHNLTPTDNLSYINGALGGDILILTSADSNRDIYIDETGNIELAGGGFVLDNIEDTIQLVYIKTRGKWLELTRSNNG